MDYLSFNAATIAKECLTKAIKRVERDMEHCGALTHKDAKQSDSAKEYFSKRLEDSKNDVDHLRRLAADLGKQAYHARTNNTDNNNG